MAHRESGCTGMHRAWNRPVNVADNGLDSIKNLTVRAARPGARPIHAGRPAGQPMLDCGVSRAGQPIQSAFPSRPEFFRFRINSFERYMNGDHSSCFPPTPSWFEADFIDGRRSTRLYRIGIDPSWMGSRGIREDIGRNGSKHHTLYICSIPIIARDRGPAGAMHGPARAMDRPAQWSDPSDRAIWTGPCNGPTRARASFCLACPVRPLCLACLYFELSALTVTRL